MVKYYNIRYKGISTINTFEKNSPNIIFKTAIQQINGFTLAEVLITLGIIGIVAAMTIPVLMNDYQNAQYTTAIRKAYSSWNQVLNLMANDAGCPGDLSCFFDSSDAKTMGDKIVPYFKVVKNCSTTQKGCWADSQNYNYDGGLNVTGNDSIGSYYKFVTADGMSVEFTMPFTSCEASRDNLTKLCIYELNIDTNGLKKPNTWGKDIFQFVVDSTKTPALYPMGGAKLYPWNTSNMCDNGFNGGTNKYGPYCAGRAIEDNWQLKYLNF